MNIEQITPTAGNILVKKLPDDTVTASGIILPQNKPANKQTCYVEVIAIGSNDVPDDRLRICVKPGDKGLVGRVPYDGLTIDNETYWLIKQADMIALMED